MTSSSTVIFRALCFLREIDVKQFPSAGLDGVAISPVALHQPCAARRYNRAAAAGAALLPRQKRAAQLGLRCRDHAASLAVGNADLAAGRQQRARLLRQMQQLQRLRPKKRLLLAQGDLDLRVQLLQLLRPRQTPGLRRALHILQNPGVVHRRIPAVSMSR